jgi:hypothetical protein
VLTRRRRAGARLVNNGGPQSLPLAEKVFQVAVRASARNERAQRSRTARAACVSCTRHPVACLRHCAAGYRSLRRDPLLATTRQRLLAWLAHAAPPLQILLARDWDETTPPETVGTSLLEGCAPLRSGA